MGTVDITGGTDPAESPRQRALGERFQKVVHSAFAGGGPAGQKIKNFLNGTWIGEPLHVILTDVPIGAWTVALICDALQLVSDRGEFATVADTSMAIGITGALAAALAGVTDWQDADAPGRRTGMIHGLLNLSATALFATSLVMRKRKSRTPAQILSTLGYGIMTYAARLGGELVYEHRVGVDRTAGQSFPSDFVPVLADSELLENQPKRAGDAAAPILLVRCNNRIFAMAETCSHFTGPLAEGKLIDESIQCPWHRSRFALEDGRVLDGPAVHPQPCLEVRVRNGQIEVRKPAL